VASVIDTWEIHRAPGAAPGTHKSYVKGPMTGDWSGAGTRVVSYDEYQKALKAIHRAREELSGEVVTQGNAACAYDILDNYLKEAQK
jgi:hypothetical protein